jgi:hypothetical protein
VTHVTCTVVLLRLNAVPMDDRVAIHVSLVGSCKRGSTPSSTRQRRDHPSWHLHRLQPDIVHHRWINILISIHGHQNCVYRLFFPYPMRSHHHSMPPTEFVSHGLLRRYSFGIVLRKLRAFQMTIHRAAYVASVLSHPSASSSRRALLLYGASRVDRP